MRTETKMLTSITLVAVFSAGGALAGESEGGFRGGGFDGRHGMGHLEDDLHDLAAAAPFGAIGKDCDGGFPHAGIDRLRGDRLGTHDSNGDGNLSLEEFAALWDEATRGTTVRMFQMFDVDGDAVVTRAEYERQLTGFVRRAENDGDNGHGHWGDGD